MTVHGRASGHASIRATHSKTLELERDAEIGDAATCVVAVGVRLDEEAIARLRGRVRLDLTAGALGDSVRATINPAFHPGDPLVVRRSAAVTRDAVMIDADKVAADLDRALVERLSDPGAAVEVTVSELPGETAPGALVVAPREPWRAAPGTPGGDADFALRSPVAETEAARANAVLDRSGRVELDADLAEDAAAIELVAAAHDGGHAVLPADGLAPLSATLAVAGVSLETVTVMDARASHGRSGRLSGGGCRVVTGARATDALRWLEQTAAAAGATRGVVGLDVGGPRQQFVPWRAGEPATIPDARRRWAIAVAGFPAAGPEQSAELPPVAVALARELLAAGSSTRDVARAVQGSTSLSRRDAYELVLEIARSASTSSVSRREPRTSR